MNATTFLVCSRMGSGWRVIKEAVCRDGLKNGEFMMDLGNKGGFFETKQALSTWLKENNFDTLREDSYIAYSTYIYDHTVPGQWCMLIWECKTTEQAQSIYNKITDGSDTWGVYYPKILLSDIKKIQYDEMFRDYFTK